MGDWLNTPDKSVVIETAGRLVSVAVFVTVVVVVVVVVTVVEAFDDTKVLSFVSVELPSASAL